MMNVIPKTTRDYFAEQFIAGVLADVGWNIYFPRRDKGFDFIISKFIDEVMVIRPVQVKGKFPEAHKKDRGTYGWVGPLSAVHPDMILVIPYFDKDLTSPSEVVGIAPVCIAFMPRHKINRQNSRGYACQPAGFKNGRPEPRRDFKQYFDVKGLRYIEEPFWNEHESLAA